MLSLTNVLLSYHIKCFLQDQQSIISTNFLYYSYHSNVFLIISRHPSFTMLLSCSIMAQIKDCFNVSITILERIMSILDKSKKMNNVNNIIIFILSTIVLYFFIINYGEKETDKDAVNLGAFLYKYKTDLEWNINDKILKLKKTDANGDSIEIMEITEFESLTSISFNKEGLTAKLNNKTINSLMLSYPLSSDIKEIRQKVIELDNSFQTNKEFLLSYGEKVYPYNINICDTNYEITLFGLKNCNQPNKIQALIDSKTNSISLVINLYPDWQSFKFEEYMNYFKHGIEAKIKNYKEISEIIKDKYINELYRKNIIAINKENNEIKVIDDNKTIEKKTIKELSFDLWVDRKDIDKYIDKDFNNDIDLYILTSSELEDIEKDLNYIIEKI